MNIYKLENFTKGWFVGDFAPSLFKTKQFEVGFLTRTNGAVEPLHYHRFSTEITLVIKGKIKIHGKNFEAGDIFIVEPWEVVDPEILEDTQLCIIKVPSIPGDKYII